MSVYREKLRFSRIAGLAAATIVLTVAGLSVPVGYTDGDLVISAAYAVGNGNGNGGVGNGKGQGDAHGSDGQAASNGNGGTAQGSSHWNGAAARGSLNSAHASAQGLAHANDNSPVGALNNYMGSMVDYATAVEDLIAAQQAKQDYLDSLPLGTEPDEEVVAELDQAIADAQVAADDALMSAAESFLEAANKDGQITEAVVEGVNGMLDGKSEGFLDPDGHIEGSAGDLVEEINNL